MSKVRVHEVAKELGVTSKEVIERLRGLGVEVKSHSSTIDDEVAAQLRNGGAAAPAAAPVEPAPAPTPASETVAKPEPDAAPPPPPPPPPAPEPEPVAEEAPAAAAIPLHRAITLQDLPSHLRRSPAQL